MRKNIKIHAKSVIYAFCVACTVLFFVQLAIRPAQATAGGDAAVLMAFFQKLYDEYLTPDDNERTAKVMTSIALASDKEVKNGVDLYNARIHFDSAVPPSMCTNNEFTEAVAQSDDMIYARTKRLNEPLENVNVATTNPYAYSTIQVKQHKNLYCGDKETDCKPSKYKNADISATNLFKDSYNDDELKAALAYAARVTNPDPTQALSKDAQQSSIAIPAQNILYSEGAKLSLAQQSINSIIADRIPSQGLGAAFKKGPASPKEVREFEVKKRYANTDWEEATGENPPSAAVKDIAFMMAYRIYQTERIYEQNQRIEALLAVMVAQQTKQWSKEQMQALRDITNTGTN